MSELPKIGSLTVIQISEDLNLKIETVRTYLKTRKIPGATKAFGVWRVDAQTYDQWRNETYGIAARDPHLFPPPSARSLSASAAASRRTKN